MFVRCEALEGFEPAAEVVGRDEVGEMGFELLVALVMVASDGGYLDGAVYPFDLSVGPGMLYLGRAVLVPLSRQVRPTMCSMALRSCSRF